VCCFLKNIISFATETNPNSDTMKLINKILSVVLLLLISISAIAQNEITVNGTVKDEKGAPVVGAAILIKGTHTGTTTDIDGRYSIRSNGNAVLIMSAIGYETIEKNVENRGRIDFVAAEDALLLQEAVAVGYGSQSKITLTGSVTQTTGEELTKSSSINLSQGLAGRMSGVIVNNRSGEPGADDATNRSERIESQFRKLGRPINAK